MFMYRNIFVSLYHITLIKEYMSTEDLQKRTTVNIQEKANLIWAIADKLVGTYKPHEFGNVILPMCVIKRFSDTLAPTKEAVLKANDLPVCRPTGLI